MQCTHMYVSICTDTRIMCMHNILVYIYIIRIYLHAYIQIHTCRYVICKYIYIYIHIYKQIGACSYASYVYILRIYALYTCIQCIYICIVYIQQYATAQKYICGLRSYDFVIMRIAYGVFLEEGYSFNLNFF